MKRIAGYKTYALVVIGVALYGAEAMGIVPPGTMDKIDGLLLVLGLGTLRSGIANK